MNTIGKLMLRASGFVALIAIGGAFSSLMSEYLFALLLTNAVFVAIFAISLFNLKKKVWRLAACVLPPCIFFSLLITSVKTGWFQAPDSSGYFLASLMIACLVIYFIADNKIGKTDGRSAEV